MDWIKIGKKIYDCHKRWINYRCVLIFGIRSYLYRHELKDLEDFLQQNELRSRFLEEQSQVFAQLTRQVFYRNSTAKERLQIIKSSLHILGQSFKQSVLAQIYLELSPVCLWKMEASAGQILTLDILFRNCEIREGVLTLALRLDGDFIYHVNFWMGEDRGEKILVIGCCQGKKNGLEISKKLTKAFFGYRPKNFVIYGLRFLAKQMGITQLKAVSNYGYYANNHYRWNRKLQVSYDKFWQECRGEICEDRRFYRLPLEEHRKEYEEIPVRKRARYRKRFMLLDQVADDMEKAVQKILL